MQSAKRQPQVKTKGSSLGGLIILAVAAFLFYLGAKAAVETFQEVKASFYEDKGR